MREKSDVCYHQVGHAGILDGEKTGRLADQSEHAHVMLVYSVSSVDYSLCD